MANVAMLSCTGCYLDGMWQVGKWVMAWKSILEGNGRGVIWGGILTAAWKDWGRTRKSLATIVGVPSEILMWHLAITDWKRKSSFTKVRIARNFSPAVATSVLASPQKTLTDF